MCVSWAVVPVEAHTCIDRVCVESEDGALGKDTFILHTEAFVDLVKLKGGRERARQELKGKQGA